MSQLPDFVFKKQLTDKQRVVVVFCKPDLALPESLSDKYEGVQSIFAQMAQLKEFEGKFKTHLEILMPTGTQLDQLFVIGVGEKTDYNAQDWISLGGYCAANMPHKAVSVLFDAMPAEYICAFAQGLAMRSYRFDKYQTIKRPDDKSDRTKSVKVTIIGDNISSAKKLWPEYQAIVDGVCFARDLVNEPANVLTTKAFAKRLQALNDLGVTVDMLNEAQLAKIGMRALLAVGQGSDMPSQVVVMRWQGGAEKAAPLVAVGKGVVFDTGGISLKPAAGMEDMKGDMGGAAAVAGLMYTIAQRKAKANVIGIVGLVENMPDGKAQRPGDIVKSLSGQTIEIINTDAEGRLVLADLLWYAEDQFKPKAIVNLATLTGAILVALGHTHAGLFSNSDQLADTLLTSGRETNDLLWRMPLGKPYDKLIDSKIADMKNTGGRWAGSITAAQFLQRFIRKVDWAHIDVAGTAMNSTPSDYNRSWGSGFGVQLLNHWIKNNYED